MNNSRTETPRQILIFRIGELGDTLVALPAIRAIRRSFPAAKITFLGNSAGGGRGVMAREILPQGLVDDWRTYASPGTPGSAFGHLKLLAQLRRDKFDLLAYLGPRIRPPKKVRRDLLFFRLAGVTKFIGHEGFAPLPRTPGGPLPVMGHEAEHLLYRLSLSGIPAAPLSQSDFDLDLRREEFEVADAWMRLSAPSVDQQRLVGFAPGSKWPSKVWPEQRFIELGRKLVRDRGVFPIIFGGAEDKAIGDRLLAAWNTGANAAGVLSPRHAAAVLSRCAVCVGNDTGTMHLAASVGTRCVTVMAAIDWPGRWNPYGEGHVVLRRRVSCEGCRLQTCTIERMRCLTDIGADEALTHCLLMLDGAGGGAAQAQYTALANLRRQPHVSTLNPEPRRQG
jgi:heptosyltransferase-3